MVNRLDPSSLHRGNQIKVFLPLSMVDDRSY
jgi:hypothetical protein